MLEKSMILDTLVSVIIPSYNDALYIQDCVLSLIKNGNNHFNIEIIIIDGGSKDNSRAVIEEIQKDYKQVKLLGNPHRYTPHALNIGIREANGEYILIASSHSQFSENYISELIHQMQDLDADVVGGVMETKIKNSNPTSVAIKTVLSNKFGVGNSMFRIGIDKPTQVDTVPFGLYKTELLRSINGYREDLIRNHDIEMSKRLLAKGARIFLVPTAKCTYFARETFGKLAKNNYSNGKWILLTVYLTKNFSSLSIRHFVPLMFVFSLILPIIAAAFFWPLAGLSVLSLFAYLLMMSIIILKIRKNLQTTFLKLIKAFFVLHFSYGIGSLVGLLKFYKLFKSV
jgi:glycosyltransferase involved in cell wall biosynthesis